MAQAVTNSMTNHLPESPTSPTRRYHIPLTVGRKSSIGDVGTIRTQLQARRAQLGKQITVEQEITRGSRKLAKMSSLDGKTRDLAALEHQFSVSKIQALQAELAKINSSLQAYQPEGVREKQIPLIPIATKTTSRISFSSPFSELVKNHYHMDPLIVQDAIYDFQELRYSIASPTKDDAGVELLYEYLSHLVLIGKRFIYPKLPHGIMFVWHDAISGVPAAQQSTTFEKACVIFCIASLHTQIAAQQDRSTIEGIEKTIHILETALGIYEYMKHNFTHSPTMDMTPEVLAFFSDLTRAQAVELQWEGQVLKGLDEIDIKCLVEYAQFTKSISECYRPLRELVDDHPLREYIPSCWSALIKIKDAHYKAIAHYYAAIIHEKLAFQCNGISADDLDLHRASIATEIHFLYTSDTTNIDELFSPDSKSQMGLVKSHLNCASVLHEYALKFKNLCKQLEPVTILQQVLEKANARTQAKKEALMQEECVAMISPTIQPSIVDLNPIIPNFSRVKVQDHFKALGPLPKFSAEFSWGKPRKLTISKGRYGYGFSIRSSKPVRVSGVDKLASAEREGLMVEDWILSMNGKDVRFLSHGDVVRMVRESPDDLLDIEVTTPNNKSDEPATPTTPTTPTTV